MRGVNFKAYQVMRPGVGAIGMLALGFWYKLHPSDHVAGKGWTILVLAGVFAGQLCYEALRAAGSSGG